MGCVSSKAKVHEPIEVKEIGHSDPEQAPTLDKPVGLDDPLPPPGDQ